MQTKDAVSYLTPTISYITPTILWHGGGTENGKTDPVYALDMHPTNVLATAGTDDDLPPKGTVRLWYFDDLTQLPKYRAEDFQKSFLICLNDHQKAVNVCRFSPDGLSLASASDRSVIIYTVKKQEDWKTLVDTKTVEKIWLRSSLEEIRDLQWSPDSSYVIAGSIDNKAEILKCSKEKKDTFLLPNKHLNYVQGVAWDPLNELVVTQGGDRVLKVYTLKHHGQGRMIKALNPVNAKMHKGYEKTTEQILEEKAKDDALFTKYGPEGPPEGSEDAKLMEKKDKTPGCNLFADSTVPSFFRRPCFSPDGKLLFAPTGINRPLPLLDQSEGKKMNVEKQSFCTHIFSRYDTHTPIASVIGTEDPSVAVKCNPRLFRFINDCGSSSSSSSTETMFAGDYRVVYAVVTITAVYVYDTQHASPLVKIAGLHLACINDCAWSSDGSTLSICSSDGYCSFIRFAPGALGTLIDEEEVPITVKRGLPAIYKWAEPVQEGKSDTDQSGKKQSISKSKTAMKIIKTSEGNAAEPVTPNPSAETSLSSSSSLTKDSNINTLVPKSKVKKRAILQSVSSTDDGIKSKENNANKDDESPSKMMKVDQDDALAAKSLDISSSSTSVQSVSDDQVKNAMDVQ